MHPAERRFFLGATTAPGPESFAHRVERWTKIGVPLLGALYVIGFAVSAFQLAHYGVSPLGLVRAQYLLAGVWALMPFAFLLTLIALILIAIKVETAATKHIQFEHVVQVIIGFAGFILLWALSWRWVPFEFPPLSRVGPVLGFALIISVALWAACSSPWKSRFWNAVSATAGAALTIIFTIGYLACFAATIYPLIPSAIGGGRPARVTITLKDRPPEAIDLIAETEKTVIVASGSETREISRELVQTIRMDRR